MTLFVPQDGRGFVSISDGTVALKKILIPFDHNPHAQTALSKASLLARGLDCGAGEIRLVHVGAQGTAPMIETPHWPGWSYDTVVRQGDVVDEIVKTEREWHPDLMVLATQGRLDFLDAMRGSTTERVLRNVRCPVLAVPARRFGQS
jgi:nucleotide-binding universal stress UspA family protein